MSTAFQKARKYIAPLKTRLREGDVKGAAACIRASIASALTGNLTKGELLDMAGLWDKAVYAANFDQGFRNLCPEGLHYQRGMEKRFLKALSDLIDNADQVAEDNRLEERDKRDTARMEALGKVKEFLKENTPKKAMVHLRKAAKADPPDFELLSAMAALFLKAKCFGEAAEGYEAALAMAPDDVATLNKLGSCYRQTGEHAKAAKCFAHALELVPNDEALLFNAARNAMDGRMWTEAHDALRLALEINPDFSLARKALKAVEKKIYI